MCSSILLPIYFEDNEGNKTLKTTEHRFLKKNCGNGIFCSPTFAKICSSDLCQETTFPTLPIWTVFNGFRLPNLKYVYDGPSSHCCRQYDVSVFPSPTEPVIVKGVLGKQFKKDAKKVTDALMALSPDQLTEMETQLKDAG